MLFVAPIALLTLIAIWAICLDPVASKATS